MFGQYLEQVDQLHEAYVSNQPFPHIVLDEFLHSGAAEELLKHFPEPDIDWWHYDNPLEKKYAKDKFEDFHHYLQTFFLFSWHNPFIEFLEKLTGIQGLIPDHRLNGGGLHQITKGGKLDVHADYNYHPVTKLDRRLNVLFYLNKNWDPAWKGQLELWDKDMTACQKKIDPIFNRLVVFNVSDTAFHGHPEPLECPEGMTRKSIALYYYTNGRPEHEKTAPHSTIYKKRPEDPDDATLDEMRQKRTQGRIKV